MAFATASSPANRKPGDNTQTTTPPQAQARPRQSPGKTEPQRARPPRVQEPRARQTPPARTRPHQRAPGPERARTSAARARPPTHARTSAAHDRTPGARRDPRARQDRQRAPGRKPGGFAADHVLVSRTPPSHARPPRAPGRKPGSGALAGPSSEFPLRRIVNLVQPWSKQAILRRLKAKIRDYLRYRKAHTRTTDRNVHFSLPRPRKTVYFDRQRPKQTVFRIAHPTRQPNPMPNKQHSRHRSR